MVTIPKPKRATRAAQVCQFLIVLPNTAPLVWRRVQVPESYSFWDLHVAIQDAMGWKDYHLHEFTVVDSKTCPPEDVGGTHGYAEFLQVIRDARHPEHDAMLQWVGGSFDPAAFSPHSITFDNPRERWQIAFEHRGSAV